MMVDDQKKKLIESKTHSSNNNVDEDSCNGGDIETKSGGNDETKYEPIPKGTLKNMAIAAELSPNTTEVVFIAITL